MIVEQISLVTVGVAGYGKVIRQVRCHTSGRKKQESSFSLIIKRHRGLLTVLGLSLKRFLSPKAVINYNNLHPEKQ